MDTKANNFWSLLGKFALIVTIIWVVTQLYNNYLKNEYTIAAIGTYSSFEIPPDIRKTLREYKSVSLLDKAYRNYIKDGKKISSITDIDSLRKQIKDSLKPINDSLKIYNDLEKVYLDSIKTNQNSTKGISLVKKIKDINSTRARLGLKRANLNDTYFNLEQIKSEYDFLSNYPEDLFYNYRNYWQFTIKNDGNKPLEELVLELPFNGVYEVFSKNEQTISGVFSNQIKIGNIKPTYDVNVNVWSESDMYSYLDDEKIRITHKYGWAPIKFTRKVTGILAWIERSSFSYLIIGFFVFILLIMAFTMGAATNQPSEKGDKQTTGEESLKTKELDKMSDGVEKDERKKEVEAPS